MNQRNIYLDYAATTPLDKRVFEYMQPYLTENWGNSSGLHKYSTRMKDVQEDAREQLAKLLGARPTEIYFTSSATEANNLALKGFAHANQAKGKHIIISAIEHPSVFQTAESLKKNGFEVTEIEVNKQGYIKLDSLNAAFRSDTMLVSVIHINNELGVIQPIENIAVICEKAGVVLHTDAVQSFGKYKLDMMNTRIGLLSASAHKIYGPYGIGLLYIRNGLNLEPQIHGGGQEENLRSSSVNVPAVLGLAGAVNIYKETGKSEFNHVQALRNDFVRSLQSLIPGMQINGDAENGSPYILNVSFPGCDAELLAMQLDRQGIAVSTGSACNASKMRVSRIQIGRASL